MPIPVPVDKIHGYLNHSLARVLDTMLGATCVFKGSEAYEGKQVFSPEIVEGADPSLKMFASSVGFAGEVSGVCYLFLGERFACQAARRITGLAEEEIDDETTRDVCGELTNMFAGAFKNCLADLGLPSTLTVPNVAQGKRMAISAAGTATQRRFAYEADGYPIYADLLLAERPA